MTEPPVDLYKNAAADWRHLIRENKRRTRWVITCFILIYMAVGLLIDLYINSGRYPTASLELLFFALVSFKILPIAMLISIGVALICLWITINNYNKLMLLGTEYRQITPETAQSVLETQLYNVVEEMKIASGLSYMPKVYLIEAPYMNAFASGYSEKSAMVAITRGLIEKLDRGELQAVMAHELSHIRHGDIKLTLMASVLSNLILMIVNVLFAQVIFNRSSNNEGRSRNQLQVLIILLRYVLPLITVLLILFLSRTREFMADAGCVELTRDNEPLARALLKIQTDYKENTSAYMAFSQQSGYESVRRQSYIFDPAQAGISGFNSLMDMFSTHPTLKKRLAALGMGVKNTVEKN